ncbi:hypothetical protein [Sciscionella marina]|uniref:hypothetical protein n=1 Tax=Sciscionella marina TaxID=508770 RepID=UPI000376B6F8|nr:hypothetical protein [Sciscionella marina]
MNTRNEESAKRFVQQQQMESGLDRDRLQRSDEIRRRFWGWVRSLFRRVRGGK